MKSRELVTCNGKASFYASIYDDLRKAAMDCGWALALHGSLANDMDIMAMPWTEEAKPVEEMIKALSTCFDGNPFQDEHVKPHYDKPHNRVVYTMAIWGDYYLDISVIQSQPKTNENWIPFKLRKADDEEREHFGCDEVLDCQLPDEDQEILISYKSGYVGVDTFMYDDGGWYLDSGCEFVTEAVAWMPKPEIYKGEEKK